MKRFLIKLEPLRHALRVVVLLLPATLVAVVGTLLFVGTAEGQDTLRLAFDRPYMATLVAYGTLMWAYFSWYGSRLLVERAKQRHNDLTEQLPAWLARERWRVHDHLPRVLGMYVFIFLAWAFAAVAFPQEKWLYGLPQGLLGPLVLSLAAYGALHRLLQAFQKALLPWGLGIYWLPSILLPVGVGLFLSLSDVNTPDFKGMMVVFAGHCALQALLSGAYFIQRRRVGNPEELSPAFAVQRMMQRAESLASDSGRSRKLMNRLFPGVEQDHPSSKVMYFVPATLCVGIMTAGTLSVEAARTLGPTVIAFASLSFLLALGNLISFVGLSIRINLHLVAVGLAVALGYVRDLHRLRSLERSTPDTRPTAQAYARQWLLHRAEDIHNSSVYPVVFVCSDGGASRSAYWVAQVLGNLHDRTGGRFSEHVFLLSGASGGNVGNTAYAARLAQSPHSLDMTERLTAYTRTDFLSPTIVRMFGLDVLWHAIPLPYSWFGDDRAAALEQAMETGSGDARLGSYAMNSPFLALSKLLATHHLPVLCINSILINRGQPAVISSVKLPPAAETGRYDLHSELLLPTRDVALSTAVVLGARFPYVSPAGTLKGQNGHTYAFADGGYFDNAGMGTALNMMQIFVELLRTDSALKPLAPKLRLYVVRISNSAPGELASRPIGSVTNDLATPVLTLAASYGGQTRVAEKRIKDAIRSLNADARWAHRHQYLDVNLTQMWQEEADRKAFIDKEFPMSWSISRQMTDRLDAAVKRALNKADSSTGLDRLLQTLQNDFGQMQKPPTKLKL